MTTINKFRNNRIESLNSMLKNLKSDLGKKFETIETYDALITEIKAAEAEKKELRKRKQLKIVNRQHKEKREILTALLSVTFPTEDIRTNEGYFHAVKVKKYPSLVAFLELYPYAKFRFKEGVFCGVDISQKYYNIMQPTYSEPNKNNFTKFETLEAAAKFNAILLKPLSFAKYTSLEKRILKENEKFNKAYKLHAAKLEKLNVYFLESENLINRQQYHYNNYYSI